MTQPLIAARAGDDREEEDDASAEEVRARPKTAVRALADNAARCEQERRFGGFAAHSAASAGQLKNTAPPSPQVSQAMAEQLRQKAIREADLGRYHARSGVRPADLSTSYTAGYLAERAKLNAQYAKTDAELTALFDLDAAANIRLCALPSCWKAFRPERSTGRYCCDACKQQAFRDRVTLRAA
jgi:hypothetical protein